MEKSGYLLVQKLWTIEITKDATQNYYSQYSLWYSPRCLGDNELWCDMAVSNSHTKHNSIKVGTEIAPIKAFNWLYLRVVHSTLLSSMSFAKRYNEKALKELQAVNVKMMSAPAAAFKILKYWSPRCQRVLTKNCTRLFSCLISKLGIRFVVIWSKVTGLKPKAQTKAVGTVLPQVYISETTQASKGTHGPVRCHRKRFLSDKVKAEGLIRPYMLFPIYRWFLSFSVLQINLSKNLFKMQT